jgi:hypothetical protein
MKRFTRTRPALILAEEMVRAHEELVSEVYTELSLPENGERFSFYQNMEPGALKWYINILYNHLLTSVRHGDRSIMITFSRNLSSRRMKDHESVEELCGAVAVSREIITKGLSNNSKLTDMKLLVHDYITLAIQLAMDEVKDIYENIPQ